MQLQVATLLAAVMTSADAEPDSCVTVSQQRCRFPFTFNNTEYSACTGAGHPIGRPRCLITVGKLLKSKLGKV